MTDSGTSNWITDSTSKLNRELISSSQPGKPVAAFLYREEIAPDDSMIIVQIIGSCPRGEVKKRMSFLSGAWRQEVAEYDNYIVQKAEKESHFITGDRWLDRSAIWARGLIAANAHDIDGHVVPMPCPAEYNFFFTHDLLLTDIGAVNFDLQRVKRDLLYIALSRKIISFLTPIIGATMASKLNTAPPIIGIISGSFSPRQAITGILLIRLQ